MAAGFGDVPSDWLPDLPAPWLHAIRPPCWTVGFATLLPDSKSQGSSRLPGATPPGCWHLSLPLNCWIWPGTLFSWTTGGSADRGAQNGGRTWSYVLFI